MGFPHADEVVAAVAGGAEADLGPLQSRSRLPQVIGRESGAVRAHHDYGRMSPRACRVYGVEHALSQVVPILGQERKRGVEPLSEIVAGRGRPERQPHRPYSRRSGGVQRVADERPLELGALLARQAPPEAGLDQSRHRRLGHDDHRRAVIPRGHSGWSLS